VAAIAELAQKANWPWLGSVAAPVAATQALREQLPWFGVVLILDVDGYALTLSAVRISEKSLHLLSCQTCLHLSLNSWLNRLIDGVANHCIRRTRRDPRQSADAEQELYDQLAAAMVAGGRLVELHVQTMDWFQSLILQPTELNSFCAGLVK